MRRRIKSVSAEERDTLSAGICDGILHDDRILNAEYVVAFHPLKDEVNIVPLLSGLLSMGKVVLLPEVVSAMDMVLREYHGEDGLIQGMCGTVSSAGALFADYVKVGAALVPGLAFSKQGERLGRGRGYYDRFLPLIRNAYKRGVCFPFQIVEGVPCDAHDIKVDYV